MHPRPGAPIRQVAETRSRSPYPYLSILPGRLQLVLFPLPISQLDEIPKRGDARCSMAYEPDRRTNFLRFMHVLCSQTLL